MQFHNIKNPELLTKLLQALALQIGKEVSYYELASMIGVDKITVSNYINILEKAYEDNSKDLWVINQLAMEYADQEIKLDKALELIDKALIYQPENSIFIDTKGWILYKMGRKEESKLEIEKSLALNPDCKDTQKHYKKIMT